MINISPREVLRRPLLLRPAAAAHVPADPPAGLSLPALILYDPVSGLAFYTFCSLRPQARYSGTLIMQHSAGSLAGKNKTNPPAGPPPLRRAHGKGGRSVDGYNNHTNNKYNSSKIIILLLLLMMIIIIMIMMIITIIITIMIMIITFGGPGGRTQRPVHTRTRSLAVAAVREAGSLGTG